LSNAGYVLKRLQKSSNLFPPPGVAITIAFFKVQAALQNSSCKIFIGGVKHKVGKKLHF